MHKKMKVKLVRSACGSIPKHRATVRGLGLKKMHQVKEVADTPQSRGMVKEVCHLVTIVEGDAKTSK